MATGSPMGKVKDMLWIATAALALSASVGGAYVAKDHLNAAEGNLVSLESKHDDDVKEIKTTLHRLDKKQGIIEYEIKAQTELLKEIRRGSEFVTSKPQYHV